MPRPTKLDPFKGYLNERVAAAKPHWIPASVLFREIQAMGYTGGVSRLKEYLIQFKQPEPDPVVRFETAPGQQLQVDFTTIYRYRSRLKAFVATLGYSRATYVRFTEQERQEDWLAGLEHAFAFFGGVTQEVLFDNAKCIMLERDAFGDGQHRWNRKMLDMSRDYNFRLRACRPYRAKTKGKVERFNGYLKGSFITPLATTMRQNGLLLTADVANAHIGPWLHNIAHQRIHGTTGQKPQILLDEELHINFQCETLKEIATGRWTIVNLMARQWQRIMLLGVVLVVFAQHRQVLKAGGYGFARFALACFKTLERSIDMIYNNAPIQRRQEQWVV